MIRECGNRGEKPIRISDRSAWLGVSTEEMLMCSYVEEEEAGWVMRAEVRDRVRRKVGVEGGMELRGWEVVLLISDRHHI